MRQRHVCKLSCLVNVWQYDYRIVVLDSDPPLCLWHYMVMPFCSINQHSEKDALRNINIGGDDFGMRGRCLVKCAQNLIVMRIHRPRVDRCSGSTFDWSDEMVGLFRRQVD